ncbi:hypothetical protein [Nonomuraea sp. NPDC003754]
MKNLSRPSILDQIPSVADEPESPEPSRYAVTEQRWSRRRLFGTVAGVTVAAGLGALDLLPWSRPRAAMALTEWTDGCHGYFNSSTVCTPSSAYYGSDNCSGSWHKNQGGSGTCYNYRYTPNETSCGGRNAWRWTGSVARRKCSDGWYEYHDCGGGNISRFSICRTAI